MMKLAASYFALRFIGVEGREAKLTKMGDSLRESPIFVNFAPQEAQNGQIGHVAAVGHS